MKNSQTSVGSIDEYIAAFPAEIQETLQNIRQVIRDAAPEASEAISYQMPTFKLNETRYICRLQGSRQFFPTPSGVGLIKLMQ